MRYIHLLTAILALAAPLGAQTAVMPEDLFPQLRELLAAAEAHSPALAAEVMTVEEARAGIDAAEAQNGVHVTAYVRALGSIEQRIGAESESPDGFRVGPYASIVANLPLYYWGGLEARRELARFRARMAEAGSNGMRERVQQEVRRYYLEYLLARQSAAIARENIAYADRRVEAQEALVQSGMLARRNLIETRIFRSEREEDVMAAEKLASFTLALLRELTGVEDLELRETPFVDVQPLDGTALDTLRDAAAHDGLVPEQAALAATLGAERAAMREVASLNKPRLDLVAGSNVDAVDDWSVEAREFQQVPRIWSFVGLQASWNIFDSGEVRAGRMASMARQRRVEAKIEEARVRRQRTAEDTAQNAALAAQQIDSRTRRLELLESIVELMERQVADNVIPANDLFERKIELERTRVELLRAKTNYLLSIALLRSAAESPDAPTLP